MNNMNVIQLKIPEEERFFDNDILDFTKYPDEEISSYFMNKFVAHRTLDLTNVTSDIKKQELKDLIRSCFKSKKPYSIKSKYMNYLLYLPLLANVIQSNSFLEATEEECSDEFLKIIKDKNLSEQAIRIIPAVLFTIDELRDTRTGTDRDIWYFKDFKIDETRKNKTTAQTVLNFKRIENVEHREYFKKWFRYLLGVTELSLGSIINYLPQIIAFSNYFKNVPIFDITEYDISYMAIKQLTDKPSPVQRKYLKKDKYVPADNLVSENTILQIFRNLHTLEPSLVCMYLINYCTGMRISDICQLPLDCLYEDNDDGYYIRVANQKMQKTIMNLIPQALFILLKEQVKRIITMDVDAIYLFPAPDKKGAPFQSATFRRTMKEWCKELGIKNDDGTDYNYTTHSYRHTLSTDLFQNYDVDLQVIQLSVLWHKEIQMSLTYTQRGSEYNRALHQKYISSTGVQSPLDDSLLSDADALHKKALSNGYCNYPTKLGTCPSSDICLDCEFFRTSSRFLKVHMEHLKEVNQNIILYRTNGWNNNLATALETKKKLENIIKTLSLLDD